MASGMSPRAAERDLRSLWRYKVSRVGSRRNRVLLSLEFPRIVVILGLGV